MDQITIIGIDCSADPAKVGLSMAVEEGADRCVVRSAMACSSEREVVEKIVSWLAGTAKALIAFDAPLGWPRPMGTALAAHRAGQLLAVAANDLFRRATDRVVKEHLGKQSLDVGADRIARTAHSALRLLANLRRETALAIPLAWEPTYSDRVAAVEVYPAATLITHGIPDTGYKKNEKIEARKAIIGSLERIIQLPADRGAMEQSSDPLDAVICVLAGHDFLRGKALHPKEPEEIELARHEGWIWVRAM